MTTIPIFFTFDDRYALPALVTFHSLLSQANPRYRYALHVLHLGLSPRWQERLQRCVGRFEDAELRFTDCRDVASDLARCGGKSHFSPEIFLKLTAASRFPQYDRILCSDVDVVFTGDIAPSFFAYPHEDFIYAGVDTCLPTQRMAHYHGFTEEERSLLAEEICAGYLLFNLSAIRASQMEERWTAYYLANYERLQFPEQDCMAICAGSHSRTLSLAHVVCNSFYAVDADRCDFYTHNRCLPASANARRAAFKAALAQPIQLHFVGALKPWNALGVRRQSVWFAALRAAGGLAYFLEALPSYLRLRLRRYSLSRGLRKLRHRLLSPLLSASQQ